MTVVTSPITNVIKFVECCTEAEIFFRGSLPISDGTTCLYTGGAPFPGGNGILQPGICYTVYNLYVEVISYPPAPPMGDLSITSSGLNCEDPICPPCSQPVKLPCYMVIPCDGTPSFVTNNSAFSSLVNTFVSVTSSTYNGCAYIVELVNNDCEKTVEAAPGLPCDPCNLICYYISNSNGVLYVDENNTVQTISSLDAKPYVKICSRVYPVVDVSSQDYTILDFGLCELNECPKQCYKLTNCSTLEVIYTNSDSVLPYLYGTNNIVKIIGRDGCWTISELKDLDICDCPIDVVITSSYATCEECIGYVAYKLTSCTNNDVIYTLLNLDVYIGQVVKINCGCYVVEQINYLPPNPQVIKLEDVYTSCIECTRTYWKLIDCANPNNTIITYSNLQVYEGKVVKIENCTECWTVEITTEHIGAVTVTVTNSYLDCVECGVPTICQCSRVTNLNPVTKSYGYYDCDNVYHQITLEPGSTSDKVCALYWVPAFNYCTCIQFKLSGESYYAYIIPDEFLNEKPVYYLCTTGDISQCGKVYWDGNNWVISAPDGNVVWILPLSTSNTCAIGDWEAYTSPSQPKPNKAPLQLTSQLCDVNFCECFEFTTEPKGTTSTFTIIAVDTYGNPIYSDGINTIVYNIKTRQWEYSGGLMTLPSTNPAICPIGYWPNLYGVQTAVSTECLNPNVFTVYDNFETFGECQFGNCPQPDFKNNRTVKPGYNTPICTPEKYDTITCNFANVLYKIALEKRYGITNCCPDDDDQALIQKELIDLQALKDPNYKCEECKCNCGPVNMCETCNCKN